MSLSTFVFIAVTSRTGHLSVLSPSTTWHTIERLTTTPLQGQANIHLDAFNTNKSHAKFVKFCMGYLITQQRNLSYLRRMPFKLLTVTNRAGSTLLQVWTRSSSVHRLHYCGSASVLHTFIVSSIVLTAVVVDIMNITVNVYAELYHDHPTVLVFTLLIYLPLPHGCEQRLHAVHRVTSQSSGQATGQARILSGITSVTASQCRLGTCCPSLL